MKIYALFTLHEVGWGTRAGIGNELAADIGKDETQEEKDLNQRNPDTHMKIEMSEMPDTYQHQQQTEQSDIQSYYLQQPLATTPYEDPFFSEAELRNTTHVVTEMGTDGSFAPTHNNNHSSYI